MREVLLKCRNGLVLSCREAYSTRYAGGIGTAWAKPKMSNGSAPVGVDLDSWTAHQCKTQCVVLATGRLCMYATNLDFRSREDVLGPCDPVEMSDR